MSLDVTFIEEQSKKRVGKAARDFSLMAKAALNLIKNHKPGENGSGGVEMIARRKHDIAVWKDDYLMELMRQA